MLLFEKFNLGGGLLYCALHLFALIDVTGKCYFWERKNNLRVMTTIAIRERLRNYIEVADDKKIKAMYVLLEEEIENEVLEYPEELKGQLDAAAEYYNAGGKMVSQSEMQRRLKKVLQVGKRV